MSARSLLRQHPWLVGLGTLCLLPACELGIVDVEPDPPTIKITLESSVTRDIGEDLTLDLGITGSVGGELPARIDLTIEPAGVLSAIMPTRVRVNSGPSIQIRDDGGLITFDFTGTDLDAELDLTCLSRGRAEVLVVAFLGEVDERGFRRDRDEARVTITCGEPMDSGRPDAGMPDPDASVARLDAGRPSAPDAGVDAGPSGPSTETVLLPGLLDANRVHALPDDFGGTGRSDLALVRDFSAAHIVDWRTGTIIETLTLSFRPHQAVPVGMNTVVATQRSADAAVTQAPFATGDAAPLPGVVAEHVAPVVDGSDAFTTVDRGDEGVTIHRRSATGEFDVVRYARALLQTLSADPPGSASAVGPDGPTLIAFPGTASSTLAVATSEDSIAPVSGSFPASLADLTCEGTICTTYFNDGFDSGVVVLRFDSGIATEVARDTRRDERISSMATTALLRGGVRIATRNVAGLRIIDTRSDGTITSNQIIPRAVFEDAGCTTAVHPTFVRESELLLACFNESALRRLSL